MWLKVSKLYGLSDKITWNGETQSSCPAKKMKGI